MAEQPGTPGTAPVTDHRPVPRGVLPRGFQTWLMAGLALGIVLIILLDWPAGAAGGIRAQAPAAPQRRTPDRLRDYQERLRAMEARQAREAQAAAVAATVARRGLEEPPAAPHRGPDRRRPEAARVREPVREQRRAQPAAGGERPDSGSQRPRRLRRQRVGRVEPSIDEIADAVVRATGRAERWRRRRQARHSRRRYRRAGSEPDVERRLRQAHAGAHGPDQRRRPAARVLEGTIIDTVLTNRLDGSGRRRELPGDEPGVLAQRTARPDSGRRTRPRRDATGSGARRDAPRRRVPSPGDAGRQHACASTSSWA